MSSTARPLQRHAPRMAGVQTNLEIMPFRGEYYEIRPKRVPSSGTSSIPCPIRDFLSWAYTLPAASTAAWKPAPTRCWPSAARIHRHFSRLGEAMETLRFRVSGRWRKILAHGDGQQYRSWVKWPSLSRYRRWCGTSGFRPRSKAAPEFARKRSIQRQPGRRFPLRPQPRMIHVCNVPSPTPTASLEIGNEIVDMMAKHFALEPNRTAKQPFALDLPTGILRETRIASTIRSFSISTPVVRGVP